ncbi:KICSTOR complex protein SZT2-like isoform X1 [Tachypleus tridentatus]|uniref:KICSTOR complex protein SZT2-like isoform X2 n=1 Tax=Tachypleus tridentatus TaxID=6853 RepID=UPI003FD354D4
MGLQRTKSYIRYYNYVNFHTYIFFSRSLIFFVLSQTLLLQDLHESRMCNQLLVPEASEDIWKQGGFLSSGHSMLGEDEHDAPEQQSYLEATIMKFMPGTFDCGVVWETLFTLRPRLNTGPGHSVKYNFSNRLNETLCEGHSGYGHSKRKDSLSGAKTDDPSRLSFE